MIEIIRQNDTWECWIGGRIWLWDDNLETLFKKLSNQAEDIEIDIND